MLATKPLPPEIESRLNGSLDKGEEILFRVDSDLATDLRFGESWLIVTNRRILVYAVSERRRNGKGPVEIGLKAVKGADVFPVVGGGMLMVRTKTGSVPLIHYSNSLSARFAEAAKGIAQLAKGKDLLLASDLKPDRCPKCNRLLVDPNERCPFCVKYFQAMGRILSYLKPYAWFTVSTVLLAAAVTAINLLPPQITEVIMDQALNPKTAEAMAVPVEGRLWLLLKMVIALLAINVGSTLISIYNGTQLSWLGGRVGRDIRAEVFQAVERLGMKFFDRRHVGNIMARIMNDSSTLQNFLIDGFPFLAQNMLMLGGIVVLLWVRSPELTFYVMLPVPLMIIGQFLFWKYVRGLSHKAWNQYALLNNRLHESVSGVRVVKAFSQENQEVRRFQRQNDKWFMAQYTVDRFWGVFFPGMSFFVTSGSLIAWWYAGHGVIDGTWTIGQLFKYTQYLWMFYGPLQWFSQINNWMTRAFVGAERIFETIDTAPESYDPPDAVAMPELKGSIEFKDVTFSYEKGRPALKEVSFKVKAGEMIGLVGKSGSGKSTLLSMLCRFYAPDEGEILIDGVPIQKIRLDDLRQNIGLVLQDPFLFGSSIYDNISYSRPDAKASDIIEAARAANAHEFIMQKNDAYDTRVGERGNRLSGGEKQRISIARAILHNPRILILDEATSSVDSETEAKIQEALDRLVRNRTTFVAAHRLSTLRNADRIFVMEEGKLIETGSHFELLKKGGMYSRLVKAQEEAWRKAKRNLSLAQ
ncbi:MAG: ABC transporter ATP-binding protein [Candidatus Coatesbacteria bacterium]